MWLWWTVTGNWFSLEKSHLIWFNDASISIEYLMENIFANENSTRINCWGKNGATKKKIHEHSEFSNAIEFCLFCSFWCSERKIPAEWRNVLRIASLPLQKHLWRWKCAHEKKTMRKENNGVRNHVVYDSNWRRNKTELWQSQWRPKHSRKFLFLLVRVKCMTNELKFDANANGSTHWPFLIGKYFMDTRTCSPLSIFSVIHTRTQRQLNSKLGEIQNENRVESKILSFHLTLCVFALKNLNEKMKFAFFAQWKQLDRLLEATQIDNGTNIFRKLKVKKRLKMDALRMAVGKVFALD